MNIQPLESYGEESFGGYGFKLLHRSYSGPLAIVIRHDDDAKAYVYPNSLGNFHPASPIEIISGASKSTQLGEFLAQPGYTADPTLTTSTPTAGVETLYDQSLRVNHLTNEDKATHPIVCDEGAMHQTEWGYAMDFRGGRFIESSILEDSFTIHLRAQFVDLPTTKYILRAGATFYAKITHLYLDEIVGAADTESLVFLNEFYYDDYTTNNITLEDDTGYLITTEITPDDNVLSDPPTWKMENMDFVHSFIMFEGVDNHVRRHHCNQMLSEDIPLLQQKLKRYSPTSYYNLIAGAKAVFGVVSFQGILLANDSPTILRARRDDNKQVDVRANTSGYISLDSPVAPKITDGSNATTLGEWVGAPGYDNPDGITHSDAYIAKLYSQGNPLEDIDLAPAISTRAPKLYDAGTGQFSGGNAQGAVALDFYEPSDSFPSKYLELTTPIYADTVVVVYRNVSSGSTQGLVSAMSGVGIMSKISWPDQSTHGLSVYDQTYFSPTQIGKLDTGFHIASLHTANTPQRLVGDTQEMSLDVDVIPNGIEGTPYEDQAKYRYVGSYSLGTYPHKGFISAVLFYDRNKYAKRQQIHDYLNVMFGIQNIPIADPINVPVIKRYTEVKGFDNSGTSFTVNSPTPSGVKNGDLLVAVVSSTNSTTTPADTPTGWTLKSNTLSGGNIRSAIFYRFATQSEPPYTAFTMNNDDGDGEAAYVIHQLRVFGNSAYTTADPIDAVGTVTGQGTPNPSNPVEASSIGTTSYAEGRLAVAVGNFYSTSAGSIVLPIGAAGAGWSTFDTFQEEADVNFGGAIATKDMVYVVDQNDNAKNAPTGDIDFTPASAQIGGQAFQFTIKMGDFVPMDKTWNFASTVEEWENFYSSVSQITTYTPSSDSAASGILQITKTSTGFGAQAKFDLTKLINYDNSETLYYRVVYSVPSTGEITGLDRVTWGNNGSFDDYTATLGGSYNTWITVEGALTYSGSDNDLYLRFDPNTTNDTGDSIYIDSIRVSHLDFR